MELKCHSDIADLKRFERFLDLTGVFRAVFEGEISKLLRVKGLSCKLLDELISGILQGLKPLLFDRERAKSEGLAYLETKASRVRTGKPKANPAFGDRLPLIACQYCRS
jgi:hypothetical protein